MGNPNIHKYARKFKKGQTGNPKGSSKLVRACGELKKTSLTEFVTTIQQFTDMSTQELQAFDKRNDVPIYKSVIARAMLEARKYGNYEKLNSIMERAYGKVPQKIVAEVAPPPIDLTKLNEQELEALNKLLSKANPNALPDPSGS